MMNRISLFICLILLVSVTACQKQAVTLYVTTNTGSLDFEKQTVHFGGEQSSAVITLNPQQRYQTMDGFGAAVTGSSAFNLLQTTPENRAKFLKETFSPTEGMGHSYIRVAIGCSDFSLSEYSCWDDKEAGFALTSEEVDYVIPVLKEILAINPAIKILGSPWTCPPWMKVENLIDLKPFNSWTSGHLNPAYYHDYADYFVKWIQAFTNEGITIYSITPQNEPLNRGNSASLFMGWDEQRDFVRDALLPHFKAAELNTKIYLFDHNYNYDRMEDQFEYPVKIYDAGVTDDLIAGAAYHNYLGNKNELLKIHEKYPDKELIFTEASIGTWNNGRDLSVSLMRDMREIALGTVNNWCRAVIVWNLMLDSDRGPNREGGCRTCYGAVDIDRANFTDITRNSHYYIISHLSAVVKPGATRIESGGYEEPGIVYAAFENTDGSYALVLLNETEENKTITITGGKNFFTYNVPQKAVVSFQWNK
jgi:glucosylceramidase